jgi:HEPN domain-containing protein
LFCHLLRRHRNNQERAEKLLKEAKGVFEELSLSCKRGEWNLSIRRSQDVVELVLKGILNQMGIEYPREHDVAPLFKEIITERKIEYSLIQDYGANLI